MERFTEQVAMVTGGAAGIGLATARRLGSEGARVVVMDWSAEDLDRTAEMLTADGAEFRCIQGDVAASADCDRAVSAALETWGRLDVLVANAGVRHFGSLLDAMDADWERVLSVNLRGTANACVAAAREMKRRETPGALVLVSSVHAEVARANMPIYDATKAAIVSLTRSLAVDLAPRIRVNCVSPGFTVTDFHLRRAAAENRTAADLLATPSGLLRRAAEPHELAAAIAFLASRDASYITATNLMVDAGVHAV